ncbi:MAG: six-hairpin glycosidase-like protein, partial [Bacteroidota bacterium]
MLRRPFFSILLLCSVLSATAQAPLESLSQDYWQLSDRQSIVWDVTQEDRLPHQENIEMAGRKVAAILYYDIDENKKLSVSRDVIFPQLRTFNKSDEPDWKKYRAYFRRTVSDDIAPRIHLGNKIINPSFVDSIEIAGQLIVYHRPVDSLQIVRSFYPSMQDRFLVEQWDLINLGTQEKVIDIAHCRLQQQELGYKGRYAFEVFSKGAEQIRLAPRQSFSFPLYFGARYQEEKVEDFDFQKAKRKREEFLRSMQAHLILETPDPVLNQLFYFSKIRAAENIFDSSMGLVHSPGGGNYYVGVWANDQVEYSGPFFPYLGYEPGNIAAYNTYRQFQKHIPEGDGSIPYAFEVDGNFSMEHLDRGDAAMIAYGTTHYLLASGNRSQAQEVWPLVEWALDYCHRKRNAAGVVLSESDEMEGRIPTGKANLSTSSLYYGGLKLSARLAKVLGYPGKSRIYESRRLEMEKAIEQYFGASMEGLDTYKYFEENKYLRHWICLPLCMGITQRQEGTLKALFDKLWTENGILVELRYDEKATTTFWDRATLYALRGAMKTGAGSLALDKLETFSRKRLLGDHVPYVV